MRPGLTGLGIGTRLFIAAREWVAAVEPYIGMHLWVFEENAAARRFYERHGGRPAERQVHEIVQAIAVAEVRYVWAAPRGHAGPAGV